MGDLAMSYLTETSPEQYRPSRNPRCAGVLRLDALCTHYKIYGDRMCRSADSHLMNMPANMLSMESATSINDISSRVTQIVMANLTKVIPAANTCEMFATSLTTLEIKATASMITTPQTLTAVEDTQREAAALMTRLQDINQMNASEISGLRDQVNHLRGAVDNSQLAQTIALLRSKKTDHDASVATLTDKKERLAAMVQRLRFMRDQLIAP